MTRPRIIPCLLLSGSGFYKTVRFKRPRYLGDPINILRIFNEKEVDEIVILDIAATPNNREPDYAYLKDLASECFMPLAFGGGIRSVDQVSRILELGAEKVVMNTAALGDPTLVEAAARVVGSQSVVISIDVRKDLFGRYEVVTFGGCRRTGRSPADVAQQMEQCGAGEILLNSVDRDGLMAGYDLRLVRQVCCRVRIPVVACGGAGSVDHIREVISEGKASAAAVGSFFVFTGPYRAVLINVPSQEELEARVYSQIPRASAHSAVDDPKEAKMKSTSA